MADEKLNKREKAVLWNVLARCGRKTDDIDKALSYYQRIIKDCPESRDINGFPLSFAARLQLAVLFLKSGNKEESLKQFQDLLKAMTSGDNITRQEFLYFINDIKERLKQYSKTSVSGQSEVNPFVQIEAKVNKILEILDYLENGREKSLLAHTSSEHCVFRSFDENHLAGLRQVGHNQILCVIFDMKRLADSLNSDIKTKFAYHEEFSFQISDQNGGIILASPRNPVKQAQKQLALADDLPPWTIAVEVAGVESLKANIEKQRFVRIITLAILLIITVLSLFFVLRIIIRERELSLLKTNFVSSVSHEMRLPLSSIRMIGEMFTLGKVKDSQMADKYYDILNTETERLTRLINRVLDFSRMDSKRQPYPLVELNLSDLIRDTVNRFSCLTELENCSIETDIMDDIVASVNSDGIVQILLNLLDNAVKYSRGGQKIKVNMFKRENEIVMEVIDSGIGMNKSVINRIFDPFYRVENELTRESHGVGIGLAIVKHIVNAHHGRIKVESEEGKGSKFSVIIPAKQEVHTT